MPTLLMNFASGLLVSFLGTLPLGVLNLTIVRVSLRQGLRPALYFALACALVEFVYSFLSVELTQALIHFPALKPATEVIAALTLLGMGVHYIRKESVASANEKQGVHPFWLGTLLSVINVVAFPFWILYTTLLLQNGYVGISGNGFVLLYVLGISVGTVTGLLPFIFGSRYLNGFFVRHQHRLDRLMGALFVGLAFCQTVTLIW